MQMLRSEQHIPKHLFAFDYEPGANLAEFRIVMENVPGAMHGQTQVIAKHDINILSGFVDAPISAQEATWCFFADFDEADVEPEALAIELRSARGVLNVKCEPSDDGFVADTMHFPVMLGLDRVVIIRAEMLASIIGKIKSIFGPESESARVILNQLGDSAGRSAFEGIRAVMGLDFIKKNVPKAIALFAALGWGRFDLKAIDFDAKTAELHMKDGFECLEKPAREPQGHFTGGLIRGWATLLFETKMGVTEIQCQAKGDPFCVFRLQPTKT